jgi:hypothetical protein
MDIELFLKELRESADVQYKIFTEGSCFRLYKILKLIYPEAIAYWSDRDNHCITRIDDKFYDIGGEVKNKYIKEKGYYEIPKKQMKAYGILKYTRESDSYAITIEKYK